MNTARYITFQLALEKEGKGAVWSGQAQTDRLKLLSSWVLNLTTIKVVEVIHSSDNDLLHSLP